MTRGTFIGLLALGGLPFTSPSNPPRSLWHIPPLQKGEEASLCRARIVTLGRWGAEVVLTYEGEASQVWAEWPGDRYQVPAKDACTGTLCFPGRGFPRLGWAWTPVLV